MGREDDAASICFDHRFCQNEPKCCCEHRRNTSEISQRNPLYNGSTQLLWIHLQQHQPSQLCEPRAPAPRERFALWAVQLVSGCLPAHGPPGTETGARCQTQREPELAAEDAEGCTGLESRKAEGGKAWLSCPQEEPGQGSRSSSGWPGGRMRNQGSVARGVHSYCQETLQADKASRGDRVLYQLSGAHI